MLTLTLALAGGGEGKVRGRLANAAKLSQFAQNGIQPQTLDELHRVIMQAIVLADAEDRHDVRVMQPGCRMSLAPEALEICWRKRGMEREDLERHVPAQRFLHRFVDDTHTSPGDLANDAIFSQLFGYLEVFSRWGNTLSTTKRAHFLDGH
jgi:hypothetical protein